MVDITQEQAEIDTLNAFNQRLAGADDSLCAIFAAARIDDILKAGIRSRLRPVDDLVWGTVFDSGMSVPKRICLAQGLGLITEDEEKALEVLLKLRNVAAHTDTSIDFSTQEHLPRVKAYAAVFFPAIQTAEGYMTWQRSFNAPAGVVDMPRTLFITATAMMVARLQFRISAGAQLRR